MHDAIILAGGENSKHLSRYTEQSYEAMIEIAGRPMVTFVAEALAASPHVRRILIAGPVQQLANCRFPASAIIVNGGRTIMDTIGISIGALGHEEKTLVVTADIPLLTPAAIDDFLRQCSGIEADLYYPIVARNDHERKYPGNKRTYVRLKEGVFTGGNIFLVKPGIVPHCMEIAEKIVANRKNPLKLCRMLGWSFVGKFIFGALKLKEVEARAGELLGIQGAVVLSGYPELGIDVDKPSDLELVRNTFSLRV
ncbi:MAG TPA: nucleotidyltransferase family protein [Methylomusa anaerophila]|uniref:2-phospho-L-lactate guanylyltransferase n=1 Tax=Methylomusa anaerophila TaxID=1930071 RepID=A0A348AGV8_9FIRM|nr:nucleotidyltransferase family protein [Methylomusa anaerophila]BBB90306.1 2-phospho-L-lactate guanylyltransferase [Methylomusa anaerophila]HML89348.1 nucleotidyltransferase family protein [Methylomusa anaerophila]